MKRISDETKIQIKAMLRSGMVGIDIADKCGVSMATVQKVRNEVKEEGHDIWHNPGKVSRYIK